MRGVWTVVAAWSSRRWTAAVVGAAVVAVMVALPTAVIPNPVFGRSVAVTWWSYPVVVVTAVLGGLLIATYVKDPDVETSSEVEIDSASKLGVAGSLIAFFAVGCPVCNKLVLLALGASGAMTWFAPLQPVLALMSLVLMGVALTVRLRNETRCRVAL